MFTHGSVQKESSLALLRGHPYSVYGLPISFQAKNCAIYGEHIFSFKQKRHTGGVITLFIEYIA